MKLFIVESPSKAKTIEKYLDHEYTVRASVGHIRDLPKSNKQAIDIEAGFVPHYEVSVQKKHVVEELTKLAKKATEIILATDPDREGEAIAWHIFDACKLAGTNVKRVTFNEITKEAVREGIKNARDIDMHLKEAQEARRVLDRIVGYELSGIIWKKVRYGLSAGRVQSPALRIIMEREREIRAFIPETYFVITAHTLHSQKTPLTVTCDVEPSTKIESDRIVRTVDSSTLTVSDIQVGPQKRSPKAPFTTSTLQQTASTRLGFSPSRTMSVAQKLYEKGVITYMRTDSTTISASALAQIADVIKKEYGATYIEARTYKTKSKNAQEAHEAIRPTNPSLTRAGITEDEKSLYSLIWARTLASNMKDAVLERTKIIATHADKTIPSFSVTGSVTIFDGWLKCDTSGRGEDVELPSVQKGDTLAVQEIAALEKQTQPPGRYSEAGLIKELEKRGIGRPSTYASIISTIEERGYVTKLNRTLTPTDTGDVVNEFLEKNFSEYISDTFTAHMEDELDAIADGTHSYVRTLREFYTPFIAQIQEKNSLDKATTLGDANIKFVCPKCNSSMQIKLGKSGKFLSCARYPDCDGALTLDGQEVGEEKPFGIHPQTGDAIYLLTGKFGPYVQLGKSLKKEPKKKVSKKKKSDTDIVVQEEKIVQPKRASLPQGIKPEDVTLALAVKLLELPRTLGTDTDGAEIYANNGRFGPYVGKGRDFRSIKKPLDAYTITLDQAIVLLNTPKALPKGATLFRTVGIHPKTGREIQILQSKSSYFIKQGLKRIFLPESFDAKGASITDVVALMSGKNK